MSYLLFNFFVSADGLKKLFLDAKEAVINDRLWEKFEDKVIEEEEK
jgi:hypothetical protein